MFPKSLAPAIPRTEMIPAAAIISKMKLKTYVLSILLRPFQVYLWGMFDKIEHLFLFCDFIIPPNFQKSIGFGEKNRTIVLVGANLSQKHFYSVKILRKNQ